MATSPKIFRAGETKSFTSKTEKPETFPRTETFKTATERNQQNKGFSNIHEPRQASKKRCSLGDVETYRNSIFGQEEMADQPPKPRVRLDGVFEKENTNRECSLQPPVAPAVGVTAPSKSLEKRRSLSPQKPSKSLKCYTCGKLVRSKFFKGHLFFGESECTQCNWKMTSCRAFRKHMSGVKMGKTNCLHTLQYSMKPSEYISSRLSQESHIQTETTCSLVSYISSLNVLKRTDPWQSAIIQCENFLDPVSSQPSETNEISNASEAAEIAYKHETQTLPSLEDEAGDLILSHSYDLKHLSDVVEYQVARDYSVATRESIDLPSVSNEGNNMSESRSYPETNIFGGRPYQENVPESTESSVALGSFTNLDPPKLSRSRKRKPKRSACKTVLSISGANEYVKETLIETPSNGYYLVVRHAIEECPMCYTELCPSRFIVNISTYLLSTVCIGCDLAIYIIFDPPDGSVPRISVLMESNLTTKQKENNSERMKVECKKMRVRDFFKR